MRKRDDGFEVKRRRGIEFLSIASAFLIWGLGCLARWYSGILCVS